MLHLPHRTGSRFCSPSLLRSPPPRISPTRNRRGAACRPPPPPRCTWRTGGRSRSRWTRMTRTAWSFSASSAASSSPSAPPHSISGLPPSIEFASPASTAPRTHSPPMDTTRTLCGAPIPRPSPSWSAHCPLSLSAPVCSFSAQQQVTGCVCLCDMCRPRLSTSTYTRCSSRGSH